jgi:pimeloyl-ACP methyl ester carboxylesterase
MSVEERGWLPCHGRQLYACLHRPAVPLDDSVALIFHSLFGEMLRNYRNDVLLARALADNGVAALRVHHAGMGHSDGSDEDVLLSRMADDAADIVRRMTSSRRPRLVLCGTRLGAVIAYRLASCIDVAALIMWHPVVRGATYLRELSRATSIARWGDEAGISRDPPLEDHVDDALGYSLSAGLRQEILAIDLLGEPPVTGDVLLVAPDSADNGHAHALALADRLLRASVDITMIISPMDEGSGFVGEGWGLDEGGERARQLLEGTVEWLHGRLLGSA